MLRIANDALTFDDVLLLPALSHVLPSEVDLKTRLTRTITLNIPLMSAAMDTVTEARLAVAMAQEGGIGIVHKNMTIEQQAREVRSVKKFESGIIRDPITITPDRTVGELLKLTSEHNISGVPVVSGRELVGIVTSRDVRFEPRMDVKISEVMTRKDKLVTAREGADTEEIRDLLHRYRIEKVLITNDRFELVGLITVKDIDKARMYPNACKDELGSSTRRRERRHRCRHRRSSRGFDRSGRRRACGRHRARPFEARARSHQLDEAEVSRCVAHRRQRGNPIRRARAGRCRCRLGQGRHRPRQHLHDAHRHRHRRAAGNGGVGSVRRTRSRRHSGDRGRRHPLFGRHCKSVSRRRERGDGRQFAGGNGRSAGRGRAVSGPHLQVVSRHGFARCNGAVERFERPLLPGRTATTADANSYRKASKAACRIAARWVRSCCS